MSTVNQKAVNMIIIKNDKTVGKIITKDPNAPKRGKSAYLFFCNAMRDKVKKSIGLDSKATDVTRELGVQWNALKDDSSRKKELTKYETMATADKERYATERESYVPDESALITKKQRRVKQPSTGPKRSRSSYLFFCTDMRDKVRGEITDNSATNVTRELGVRWNLLKEAGNTQKYVKLAAADKERYLKEKGEGVVTPSKEPKAVVKEAKSTAKSTAKATAKATKTKIAPKKSTKVISQGNTFHLPLYIKQNKSKQVFISDCMSFAIDYTLDRFSYLFRMPMYQHLSN